MDPPPPRQTRKQTFTSGSLSTGRTKDNLLAEPSHTSNINNPTQAKIFLINKALLPDNRDPAHPNLSKALLDLTFTCSGINAITADALRAIAILLDEYVSSTPSPPPPQIARPTNSDRQWTTQAQQTEETPSASTTPTLETQINRVQNMVDALYAASQANTTSSEVLTRTVDEARDDLHRMAKVVNDSVEELVTTPASIKDSLEELWKQPPHPPRQPTQYRDAVLGVHDSSDRSQAPQPTPLVYARANAAVKDRQILLNFDLDHPLMRTTPTRRQLIDFIQKAIDKLDPSDGPVIQIKAISSTKSGSPILELNSLEATNWLKDLCRRQAFFDHLGGKVQVKERLYHLVVPFLPTSTKTDDHETLRSIEHESDIPEKSITKLKWIKDPSRRDARQRVAHALLSISSPHVANQVIKDGLYLNQHKYHPRKDRK